MGSRRLALLADVFALKIVAYAVLSNHRHIVTITLSYILSSFGLWAFLNGMVTMRYIDEKIMK